MTALPVDPSRSIDPSLPAKQPDRESLPGRAWPAAILATVVGNACPMMQPLLVGIYVDTLQFGVSAAGYISAAELTGLAVAAIVTSRSIGRRSLGLLGVAGCVLFCIANIASTHATSAVALIIARIAAGGGAGIALAVGSAIAARTRAPERVFALAFAGITLYGLLFFPTSAYLFELFGPAGLYWTKATLGALAASVIGASLYSSRVGGNFSGSSARNAARMAPERAVVRFEDRLRILGCGFALYVGHGAVWTYEERMGVRAGLSAAEIGQAFGLASIGGFFGAMIAATLGARLGRTVPQLLALGFSVLAALLIIASQGPVSFTVSACLIALAWFYGVPYLAGVASTHDPSGQLAGELSAVMSAGIALGPLIGASIVSSSFAPIGWAAAAAYLICCVLIVKPSRQADGAAPPHPNTHEPHQNPASLPIP